MEKETAFSGTRNAELDSSMQMGARASSRGENRDHQECERNPAPPRTLIEKRNPTYASAKQEHLTIS